MADGATSILSQQLRDLREWLAEYADLDAPDGMTEARDWIDALNVAIARIEAGDIMRRSRIIHGGAE